MHADLERLIRLQRLEDLADQARRSIADEPAHQLELDTRLAEAQRRLDEQRQHLAANQAARRAAEKELEAVQARLSKFKDQLMAVKTNREYQAMQKELEVAHTDIRRHEDHLLERMIEHDERVALLQDAEREHAKAVAAIDEERVAVARDVARSHEQLAQISVEREGLVAQINPSVLFVFGRVRHHHQLAAVAEARDGRCGICNVRLRLQMYNDIRRNDSIIQCESCHRILYFVHPTPPAEP